MENVVIIVTISDEKFSLEYTGLLKLDMCLWQHLHVYEHIWENIGPPKHVICFS